MENNVKPGESERFLEEFDNMLENHDSYSVLDFVKVKRREQGTWIK